MSDMQWLSGTLQDIAGPVNDKWTPSQNQDSVPYIGLEHILPENPTVADYGKSSEVISTKNQFKKGDTLFGKLRPYLKKIALANFTGVCSTDIIPIRASTETDPAFLYYLISSPKVIAKAVESSTGNVMPRASWHDIREIEIEIPPLPEQKKIAEILSGIDHQIERFHKSTSNIELLRTSVLKSLLKRAEAIASKEVLGSIVEVINGRAYKLSEWEDQGTPVIRLQNLTQRGGSFYYSNLQLPDKQYCNKGDLLFMWSASFGPYIWWGDKSIFHYHIWKMIPKSDSLSKDYLYLLLQDKTQEWKSQGSGMAMIHLTKEGIEKESISLPPISEQQRIVAIMKSIDIYHAATEQKLEKLLFLKNALSQDLLSGRKRVTI